MANPPMNISATGCLPIVFRLFATTILLHAAWAVSLSNTVKGSSKPSPASSEKFIYAATLSAKAGEISTNVTGHRIKP